MKGKDRRPVILLYSLGICPCPFKCTTSLPQTRVPATKKLHFRGIYFPRSHIFSPLPHFFFNPIHPPQIFYCFFGHIYIFLFGRLYFFPTTGSGEKYEYISLLHFKQFGPRCYKEKHCSYQPGYHGYRNY